MSRVINFTNRFFGLIYVFMLALAIVFPKSTILYYTEFIHITWMLVRPYEFEIILLFLLASLIVNWVAVTLDTSRWIDVTVSIITAVHFLIDGVEYLETMKKYLERFPDKQVPLEPLTTLAAIRVYLLIFLDLLGAGVQPLMMFFAVLVVLNNHSYVLGVVEFVILITTLVFSFVESKYFEAVVLIIMLLITIRMFQDRKTITI